MTTNDPDRIRSDIERTREELGEDVDALADKVTPSKVVHRQTSRVRSAVRSARDRVMGVGDDMATNISEAGHTAVDKAKGNPLAVGLAVFSIGWLVASLIPASEQEKRMADKVKEGAQPLVDEATGVAKEMGEHLKEPARESMDAVKERAQEGVDTVTSEAKAEGAHVKDEASSAAQDMRNQQS